MNKEIGLNQSQLQEKLYSQVLRQFRMGLADDEAKLRALTDEVARVIVENNKQLEKDIPALAVKAVEKEMAKAARRTGFIR